VQKSDSRSGPCLSHRTDSRKANDVLQVGQAPLPTRICETTSSVSRPPFPHLLQAGAMLATAAFG